ncbi:3-oxoacyl-[acyl-carrier-protein] reductase [Phytohabitans flavus]|uniref:3-ketoacyl-ACP reductase n=1 Tax=Phytohabitans flavus TaxID=1076124 RepID=A0A6F8XRZ4_9ACTN|nr:SDR family oxidoreductase [Phytohabitans flavus]BCB76604.1 3-ketoacyl-ACP reductase [Phytohabitans flavus]
MEQDLASKTALVTGSGRNIGRAVALEFAARGANVIVNSRTNREEVDAVAKEARDLGVGVIAAVGDISQQETIDEIAAQAKEQFGGVDIYVSNAAIRPFQSFFDLTVDDWLSVLNTQLNASFRLAKTFVPGMVEKKWGRIIHITGPDAFLGLSHRAHNVTAKGGLRALTKSLAIELGPFGITVNDVAPGAIDTIKNDASHPHVTKLGAPDENHRGEVIGRIPVGRLGTPEDLAYACGFLASPRAGFITGTVLPVFGAQWNVG